MLLCKPLNPAPQVLCTLAPHRDLQLALALAGGRGDDVAVTLNPVAGRGLTALVRHGCALHQACQGAGAGFSWRAAQDATLAAVLLHDGESLVLHSRTMRLACMCSV